MLYILLYCCTTLVTKTFLLLLTAHMHLAMFYRPFGFLLGNIHISTCLPGKPLGIFKPCLVYVITLPRPTNTPSLVEIGSQVTPPRGDDILSFCALAIG